MNNTLQTVWEVRSGLNEKFAQIGAKDMKAQFSEPIIFFEGESLLDGWTVPRAKFYFNESMTEVVDFPFYEHGILCCKTGIAREIASRFDTTEILQVDVEGYDYSLVNVINSVDALIEDQCKFRRFKNGVVAEIYKYSFGSMPDTKAIFKLPHLTRTDIYCSQPFYDMVKQNGWRGLRFTEVFPNDQRSEWDRGLK